MKKLVLVLAVLLVSLPAMAAVTITAECDGDVYTVSYATDGNLPRAFALDIEVDAGTIDAIGGLSADYDIYPGSIVIIDGEVNDPGSAECDDAYPDTLGGTGTAGVTIEMGSLYADGDPAPDTNGVLFTFTVSDTGATVDVNENGIRGGVVMEDPEEDVTVIFDIGTCGGCATCAGDLTGDDMVSLADLSAMVSILSAAGSPYQVPVTPGVDDCGDLSDPPDDMITLADLSSLVAILSAAGSPYQVPCP